MQLIEGLRRKRQGITVNLALALTIRLAVITDGAEENEGEDSPHTLSQSKVINHIYILIYKEHHQQK